MKTSIRDWTQFIHDLETQTREGRSESVVRGLQELKITRIPRKHRHQIAELARRNSDPMLALRVMNSVIRGKGSELQAPTDLEKIAYANSLTALGCNRESVDLLKTVSPKSQPKVNLFMTFAYVGLWEYQKTIPLLKSFIANPATTNYEVLVGQVNLLAAYVDTGDWAEFEITFQKVVKACEEGKFHLLLGNTYELKGQSLIAQKQYQEALVFLDQAEFLLKEVGGVYLLFVKKWQLIARLLQGKLSLAEAAQQSGQLKQQASQFNVWEVFRDLDLYSAIAFQNELSLRTVLDSTPMPNFRRRANKIAETELSESPVRYFCCPQSKFEPKLQSIRRDSLVLPMKNLKGVTESKLLWKCFLTLIQDGYKPVSLGRMYSELFPKTYFDPYSAEKRVHNVISRLRREFAKAKVPLSIETRKNEFYLSIDDVYEGIELEKASLGELPKMQEFKNRFQGRTFSAKEAQEILEISRDQIQALIKSWVEKKKAIKIGKGPSTRYKFWNKKIQNLSKAA